jgi:hypothetical protein
MPTAPASRITGNPFLATARSLVSTRRHPTIFPTNASISDTSMLMAAEGWQEVSASIDGWLDGVLDATMVSAAGVPA